MLRLALIGREEEVGRYARIAPRLRGATFVTGGWAADFDAVVLHGPPSEVAPQCRRAAAAGKHILVEGALAPSAAEAAQVVAACSGVRLMAGPLFRFLPSLQVVKSSLDKGSLGEPGLLRIHRWEPADRLSAQPPLAGDIDLACWLFGRAPTEVYAAGRPDYTQLHLGFAGGMALIDHARGLPPGDAYFSLSLIGSAGAAYADDHHNTHLLFGGGHPSGRITGPGDVPLLAWVQEFIRAVAEGRGPAVTGEDSRRSLEVAEAAARSLQAGRALALSGREYTLVG